MMTAFSVMNHYESIVVELLLNNVFIYYCPKKDKQYLTFFKIMDNMHNDHITSIHVFQTRR